jgi:Glutamate-cysteine ligase family 2(GCS2)
MTFSRPKKLTHIERSSPLPSRENGHSAFWSRENGRGFHFGIEAEYLLVEAETFRPLWHHDLDFEELNAALETIPVADLPPLDGLELEPPHRKLMPFVVEGYHLPSPEISPRNLLPKGIEIRTPVCPSIGSCLESLRVLHERMQVALGELGYQAVSMSHHPTADHFEGPQNKRRHDFWQWAMLAMTTYGPDVNVSLPPDLNERLDFADLHAKVNYYAPALTALSLASPFYLSRLWEIRGRVGKSIRTYRRSVIAPAIELHPHEAGRLEYKTFETSNRLGDFHAFFLLWLELLLDDGLHGRASDQTRIYDLGAVARDGLAAETVRDRAAEVLERAPGALAAQGFDPGPLEPFRLRLETGRLPADDLIDLYERERSIHAVLRDLATLVPAERAVARHVAAVAG